MLKGRLWIHVQNTAGEHGTTGFGGGGATARPAEASGRDLKGERLSDFEGQVGDHEPADGEAACLSTAAAVTSPMAAELADLSYQLTADSMLLDWCLSSRFAVP